VVPTVPRHVDEPNEHPVVVAGRDPPETVRTDPVPPASCRLAPVGLDERDHLVIAERAAPGVVDLVAHPVEESPTSSRPSPATRGPLCRGLGQAVVDGVRSRAQSVALASFSRRSASTSDFADHPGDTSHPPREIQSYRTPTARTEQGLSGYDETRLCISLRQRYVRSTEPIDQVSLRTLSQRPEATQPHAVSNP
jgi:hypothetical protein